MFTVDPETSHLHKFGLFVGKYWFGLVWFDVSDMEILDITWDHVSNLRTGYQYNETHSDSDKIESVQRTFQIKSIFQTNVQSGFIGVFFF